MKQVISSDTLHRFPRLRESGVRFRNLGHGPEDRLITSFLNRFVSVFDGKNRLTIFREPQLGNAFPDLVLVIWNEDVIRDWCAEREKLTRSDLQILQCLLSFGLAGEEALRRIIGRDVSKNLERLHTAGIAYRAKSSWGIRSTNSVFAVSRLIAIEAKQNSWRRGVFQAARNRWFASESYLLLGVKNVSPALEAACRQSGIGLFSPEHPIDSPPVRPPTAMLPRSHGSWIFNEWVWRTLK